MLLWPAAIDDGLPPTILSPVPETTVFEIFTDETPLLVTVKPIVLLLPTETLPNAMVAGLGERTPVPVCPGWPDEEPALV